MARGNSRANSERAGSPEDFKKTVAQGAAGQGGKIVQTEEGYRAELISHFKDLVKEGMGPGDLFEIPDSDLQGIAESVAGESSETRDQRDEFDRSVEAGEKALKSKSFDWQDKRAVGDLVPLTFSEVQDGTEGYDVLMSEYEDSMQTDPAYDDARAADREYEDNEGEPASLRGNSREDALFADWAKGFIKDRIESASSNRDDYDDEINTIEMLALEDNVDEWRDNR